MNKTKEDIIATIVGTLIVTTVFICVIFIFIDGIDTLSKSRLGQEIEKKADYWLSGPNEIERKK